MYFYYQKEQWSIYIAAILSRIRLVLKEYIVSYSLRKNNIFFLKKLQYLKKGIYFSMVNLIFDLLYNILF